MKIAAEFFKRNEVIISHKEESVRFLTNSFTKEPFQRDYDVFDQINRYWAEMPEKQQDEIFSIYRAIHAAFDYSVDSDELYVLLNQSIIKLLEHHPLSSLQIWLLSDYTIVLPDTVSVTPPEFNDNTLTEGKTYTKQDYYPLLALCMFFRTLVPIFGEYIASIREDTEMSYKEFRAMHLLVGTGILETPAIQRLQIYINEITAAGGVDNDKILNGFSSEDSGFAMLALVCIRRLFLVDLRGTDPKKQVIAATFKFLAQRTFNGPESSVTIKREMKGGESDDVNKHSIYESFRKRQEISLGDKAELDYYFEDIVGIAKRLEPSITEEEIQNCLITASVLQEKQLGDFQLTIMAFMIKNQITPHAVSYVSKQHNCMLLAAMEAVLWRWGFKHLALLMTSHMMIGQEEIVVSNISSREQISQELVSELKQLYPYEWTSSKKGVITSRSDIVESIEKLVDILVFNAWRATASEERLIEVFGAPKRKLPIHSDIKNTIASFLIFLEKKHIENDLSNLKNTIVNV